MQSGIQTRMRVKTCEREKRSKEICFNYDEKGQLVVMTDY